LDTTNNTDLPKEQQVWLKTHEEVQDFLKGGTKNPSSIPAIDEMLDKMREKEIEGQRALARMLHVDRVEPQLEKAIKDVVWWLETGQRPDSPDYYRSHCEVTGRTPFDLYNETSSQYFLDSTKVHLYRAGEKPDETAQEARINALYCMLLYLTKEKERMDDQGRLD
jgi:hypothetical protein